MATQLAALNTETRHLGLLCRAHLLRQRVNCSAPRPYWSQRCNSRLTQPHWDQPRPATVPATPTHRLHRYAVVMTTTIRTWAAAHRSISTGHSASSTNGPTPSPRHNLCRFAGSLLAHRWRQWTWILDDQLDPKYLSLGYNLGTYGCLIRDVLHRQQLPARLEHFNTGQASRRS